MSEERINDVATSEEVEVIEPQSEIEDSGVYETETTEPSSNESEVNVADGESRSEKAKRDSAFAEMRRNMQEAERRMREAESKVASMEANQRARAEALSKLTGGKQNADLQALADSYGINVEDVMAVVDDAQAKEMLKLEVEQLKEQIASVETERALDNALVELEKIDNTLSDDEISEIFKFHDNGNLSVEDAYYVVKAKEINTRKTPPKDIGGVKDTTPQGRDWLTEKEVDAMTPEQQEANWQKIIRSMPFWK